MTKNAWIVSITIQLLFNACFMWYLADIRETAQSQSTVDLSNIESSISDIETQLIDMKYDIKAIPTSTPRLPDYDFKLTQIKNEIDRIRQCQQFNMC